MSQRIRLLGTGIVVFLLILFIPFEWAHLKILHSPYSKQSQQNIRQWHQLLPFLSHPYSPLIDYIASTASEAPDDLSLYWEISFATADNAPLLAEAIPRMQSIGYTHDDIRTAAQSLSADDFLTFSHIRYLPEAIAWMKQSDFDFSLLARYLWYDSDHSSATDQQIIEAVRQGDDIAALIKRTQYENVATVDPSTTDMSLLINQQHRLFDRYAPDDLFPLSLPYGYGYLREEAYVSFHNMVDDASREGYAFYAQSSYRSFSYQKALYESYVVKDGTEAADRYSARPGHSEHQTGLAVDLAAPDASMTAFETAAAFSWLQEHAHEYGWVLRYPSQAEAITGYQYEPWQFRYVGLPAATILHTYHWTLEEYHELFQ